MEAIFSPSWLEVEDLLQPDRTVKIIGRSTITDKTLVQGDNFTPYSFDIKVIQGLYGGQ